MYKIKYKLDFGNFTKEELTKDDCGGCESMIIVSIIGEPLNGEAMSVQPIGVNGTGCPLTSEQAFEALVMAIFALDEDEMSDWQIDAKNELLSTSRKARWLK